MNSEENRDSLGSPVPARRESEGIEQKRLEDEQDLEDLCRARPDLASKFELLFEHLSPDLLVDALAGPSEETATPPDAELPAQFKALLERLRMTSEGGARYEVLEEIARGGMGAILRVRQDELDRDLAMKVMLGGESIMDADARILARFLDEAVVTGKLEHPGVVPVHELGLDGKGRVFFTMKLVRGSDLAEIFERVSTGAEGWTQTRAIGVLLKACEALAYAHEKGVIHRDLKPSNIMVGRFGEVYVMDWGLAKVQDSQEENAGGDVELAEVLKTLRKDTAHLSPDSPLMTRAGDVVGTPAYMPPEQALGKHEELGPRSDIYSMGAILYHLLAGRMPYARQGRLPAAHAILAALLSGEPQPLHEANSALPVELTAICERAMARTPARRYPTMVALADDLRAYLEGRVVRAYETGALAEFRKWFLRNRALAGSLAAALLLLVAGSIGYAWMQNAARRQIQNQKDRADENWAKAERKKEEALSAQQEADTVATFLEGLFQSSNPRIEQQAVVTAEDLLDRGAKSIEEQLESTPVVRARLMSVIGKSYVSLGAFDKAEPLLDAAYADQRTRLGDEDPRTVAVLGVLASFYIETGRYEQAEPACIRQLEIERRLRGDLDSETLVALNNLGTLYYLTGRYEEAEPIFEEALAGLKQVQGDEGPETLGARQSLALLYWAQGRLDEARTSYEETYEISRRVRGEDNPDTLTCLNGLATVYKDLGDVELAETLFLRAIEGRKRKLGPDHPDTLNTIGNLAVLYMESGDLEHAEALFLEKLKGTSSRFGAHHFESLRVHINLSVLYYHMGRLDTAEGYGRSALGGLTEQLGPDHPLTLQASERLGSIMRAKRDFDEAERLFRQGLEGLRKLHQADHPEVVEALWNLALVYYDMQRFDEAVSYAQEVQSLTAEDDFEFIQAAQLLKAVEARGQADGD